MHGIKFEALNHLTQHIMLLYYYTLPAHLTPSLLKKKNKKKNAISWANYWLIPDKGPWHPCADHFAPYPNTHRSYLLL